MPDDRIVCRVMGHRTWRTAVPLIGNTAGGRIPHHLQHIVRRVRPIPRELPLESLFKNKLLAMKERISLGDMHGRLPVLALDHAAWKAI